MFTRIENLPAGAIGFEAVGRITGEDRIAVLEPTIAAMLGHGRPVRLLYLAGSRFTGYDPNTLLDDAVFGTRHFRDFEKISFLAEEGPYSRAVVALEGLMPADLKVFPTGAVDAAKAWLAE
jgi:SpoIIAA-like